MKENLSDFFVSNQSLVNVLKRSNPVLKFSFIWLFSRNYSVMDLGMMTPKVLTSRYSLQLSPMPGKCLLYHLGEMGFVDQSWGKVCLEMVPEGDDLELCELGHLKQSDTNRVLEGRIPWPVGRIPRWTAQSHHPHPGRWWWRTPPTPSCCSFPADWLRVTGCLVLSVPAWWLFI